MKRWFRSRLLWGLMVSSIFFHGCDNPTPVSSPTGPAPCRAMAEPSSKDSRRVWFQTIDRLMSCSLIAESDERAWALRSRAARIAGRFASLEGWLGWECRRLAEICQLDQTLVCPKGSDAGGGSETNEPERPRGSSPPMQEVGLGGTTLPRWRAGVPVPPIPRSPVLRRVGSDSKTGSRAVSRPRMASGHKGTSLRLVAISRPAGKAGRFDPNRWIFGDLLDVPMGGVVGGGTALAPTGRKGSKLLAVGDSDLSGRLLLSRGAIGKKPAVVKSVRCFARRGRFRVILAFDGPVSYSGGVARATANRPHRLYLDLAGVDFKSRDFKRLARCAGGIVSSLRTGRHGPGSRIVFDVPTKARFLVYFLTRPFRLVVDLRAAISFRPGNVRVVALDPGHGGASKGAVGAGGLEEKTVTLAIARYAAKALRRAGFRVVLTRRRDRDRSLEDRTAMALAEGADLFVSIHANSDGKGRRQAVETYFLDLGDDDFARRLAERENEAAGAEVDRTRMAFAVALEASRQAESKLLARSLQKRVLGAVRRFLPKTGDGGVRRALFAVLLTARVPAALVEVSYISNPAAEKALARRAFQEAVGKAIARGVVGYKSRQRVTLEAKKKKVRTHRSYKESLRHLVRKGVP